MHKVGQSLGVSRLEKKRDPEEKKQEKTDWLNLAKC